MPRGRPHGLPSTGLCPTREGVSRLDAQSVLRLLRVQTPKEKDSCVVTRPPQGGGVADSTTGLCWRHLLTVTDSAESSSERERQESRLPCRPKLAGNERKTGASQYRDSRERPAHRQVGSTRRSVDGQRTRNTWPPALRLTPAHALKARFNSVACHSLFDRGAPRRHRKDVLGDAPLFRTPRRGAATNAAYARAASRREFPFPPASANATAGRCVSGRRSHGALRDADAGGISFQNGALRGSHDARQVPACRARCATRGRSRATKTTARASTPP